MRLISPIVRTREGRSFRFPIRVSLLCVVGLTLTSASRAFGQDLFPVDSVIARSLRTIILRSNSALAARKAALDAERTRLDAAGLAPPAVLSGELEDVAGGTDLGGAGIRLQVEREFLTGGRRSAARSVAAAEIRAAEAALYAAERRLVARGYGAFARIAAAEGIARRLAAEDSLLVATEAALRGRFAVGEARYVDVLRLRTERLRVQTERAQALARARVARSALVGLVAEDEVPRVEALVASAPAALLAGPVPPAPDLDSLIALSGALRLADAAVVRARAERALIVAEQRPRISGAIGAQRIGGEIGGASVGPVVEAQISLPFTARRANRAASLAAERDVQAATAERTATLADVRASLAAARTRYEAARERLAVYDAALLRGAREERESALASYRTGELSLIELIDFERALARAETERLSARAEAAEALADLLSGAVDAGDIAANPESR